MSDHATITLTLRRTAFALLALLSLAGVWWTYQLVWGKPLSVRHFHERVFIEHLLDDPQLLTELDLIDNTLLDFHSDELTDASPARAFTLIERAHRNLGILHGYDWTKQSEADRLSSDILAWFLNTLVDGEQFVYHSYPLNPRTGIQLQFIDFMDTAHQVVDERSAKRYIERLSKVGIQFSQVLEGLRIREREGIILPKALLERTLNGMGEFLDQPIEENPLLSSFRRKLEAAEHLSTKTREALYERARDQLTDTVKPAYERLFHYLEHIAPAAPLEVGAWSLPNGPQYYAYKLRYHTTTDITPEVVYELGLREVARLHNEIRALLESLGHTGATVAEHLRRLSQDPRFFYPQTEAGRRRLLNDYEGIIAEIDRGLSHVFEPRPALGVEVKALPPYMETTSFMAYYTPPPLNGSRAGVFYVNLRDFHKMPSFLMRTLAYHETIPGHHLQTTIQQQMTDVPTYRRVLPFTAYVEGWALYAERLAWEYGFHPDPYSDLGRLQGELIHAAQLVVDSGLHHKRWSPNQAIEYLYATTGMPLNDIFAELERIILEPGESCAYTVGLNTLLELREQARRALGESFSIRDFHTAVLRNGAMPLAMLEERMRKAGGY